MIVFILRDFWKMSGAYLELEITFIVSFLNYCQENEWDMQSIKWGKYCSRHLPVWEKIFGNSKWTFCTNLPPLTVHFYAGVPQIRAFSWRCECAELQYVCTPTSKMYEAIRDQISSIDSSIFSPLSAKKVFANSPLGDMCIHSAFGANRYSEWCEFWVS